MNINALVVVWKNIMKQFKNIQWFIFYFVIVLLIGLFIRDAPGQDSMFLNTSSFLEKGGYGDPRSFVKVALDICKYGWVTTENLWLIDVWPPGFMYLEGIILKIFGENAPFILILIVINSFVYAGLLLLFKHLLQGYVPVKMASLLPLVPFVFPMIRLFLLEPVGIVFGEGFAIAFFLAASILVLKSIKIFSWKTAIFAGILFALSAYFRSTFELMVSSLTLFVISYVVLHVVLSRINIIKGQYLLTVKSLLLAVLVANMLMMPWRLYHYFQPSTHSLSWTVTHKGVFIHGSLTDEQLTGELARAGGSLVLLGGGNIACKLDSSYCGKPNKKNYYRVFRENLIEWCKFKISIFDDFWFSSSYSFGTPLYPTTISDKIENSFYLIFSLLNFVLLFILRKIPESKVMLLQYLSFCTITFVASILAHLEVRYLFAIKIYSLFTFIILFCIFYNYMFQRNNSRV